MLLWLSFYLLDATVYVGGLDEKVSEPLLWELFLQAGPVVNTHMPKDRVTGQHQGEYNTSLADHCCSKDIVILTNSFHWYILEQYYSLILI